MNKTKQLVQGTSKLTHCHIEQRVELDSILINAVGGRVQTLSNMTQKNMFEPIDFNTWHVKAAVWYADVLCDHLQTSASDETNETWIK